MRILYLTNGFPYPLTSGYLRHYHFIRELSQRHRITLLSLVGDGFDPSHVHGMEPYTERVLVFKRRSANGANGERLLRHVGVARAGLRAMRATVDELVQGGGFDALLLSGKETLPAVSGCRQLPLLVDVCDAASLRIRRSLRHTPTAELPVRTWDYLRMRRVERRMIARGARLFFASERDREALLREPDARASVVPNGVDLDYWKRSTSWLGRGVIVFTGAMHYGPNADAAIHLIEDVLPRVRSHHPEARVWIVGRDPQPRLAALAGRPGVRVTGAVADVRPFLDQATVFAAPLRFGAGIQNKVLEALAFELPVVATPIAADGLRTSSGTEPPLTIATHADAFAGRLVEELRQRADDPTPARSGRAYVAAHFHWPRSAGQIEEALIAVTRARSAGAQDPGAHESSTALPGSEEESCGAS